MPNRKGEAVVTATVSPFGSDVSLPVCALSPENRGGPRPPGSLAGRPAKPPFSLSYTITSQLVSPFLVRRARYPARASWCLLKCSAAEQYGQCNPVCSGL